MRLLIVDNKKIKINGNIFTPFFYYQEFGRDLYDDIENSIGNGVVFNQVIGRKIVWSLAKSSDFNLVGYEEWIIKNNFIDSNWWLPLVFEIEENIFIKEKITSNEVKEKLIRNNSDFAFYFLSIISVLNLPIELVKNMSINSVIEYLEKDKKPRTKIASQTDIDRLLM